MLGGSIARFFTHVIVVVGGISIYYLKISGNRDESKALPLSMLALFIFGYVIIELLGLPVDIFNFTMANSENSIGIAQGLTALILNWVYMVINLIIVIATAFFLIWPQLRESPRDLSDIG
jgi:hypothetical protein